MPTSHSNRKRESTWGRFFDRWHRAMSIVPALAPSKRSHKPLINRGFLFLTREMGRPVWSPSVDRERNLQSAQRERERSKNYAPHSSPDKIRCSHKEAVAIVHSCAAAGPKGEQMACEKRVVSIGTGIYLHIVRV